MRGEGRRGMGQKLPSSGVWRKQAASNPSKERNPDMLDVQSMALELGGGAGGSSEPGSTQQSRQQQPAAGPVEGKGKVAVEQAPAPALCFLMDHLCPSMRPWFLPPAVGVSSSPWLPVCPCPSWLVPNCSFLMCRTTAVALKACCGKRGGDY